MWFVRSVVSCFVDVLLSVFARTDSRWSNLEFVSLMLGFRNRHRCDRKVWSSRDSLAFHCKAGAHGPRSLHLCCPGEF